MAGKTKINGTAYTIKGGKTKVNGTAYSIKKGPTKINGTAKNILFRPAGALYWEGDECTSLTGGWECNSTHTSGKSMSIGVKNSDNLSLTNSGTSHGFNTVNKFDLSLYTKLCIDCIAKDMEVRFISSGTDWGINRIGEGDQITQTTRGIWTLDISGYSGIGYLVIYCFSWYAERTGTVYRIWLE